MRAAGFILVLLAAGPAQGEAEPAPRAEAERTFEEGNRRFHDGDYHAAIPLFQRAYDLSGEPALIFNIAQSHRLAGECQSAIAAYRRFLGLAGDSALREAAQGHIDRMAPTCPVAAPATPPLVVAAVRPVEPPQTAPPPWRAVGLVVTGAGLLGAAGAGTLYLWNGSRYRRWQAEDSRLDLRDGSIPPAEALARQEVNDELWRSIKRTDRTSLGLAIASGAVALGGAVLWLSFRSDRAVSVAFTGTGLAGEVRW